MNQPPELSFENLKLTDLIDISILQKMQDAFAKMARMASLTADENGVAVTAPSNFTELCTKFCRTSPIGKARCENCDKLGAVMTLEQRKPVSYRCHADLVDFAAPIMLGDRMIGSFIGGQVLPQEPNIEKMRQIAREIEVDEDAFIEAALKTQIIPQSAIDRSTEFLYEFARIISDMAYNSYVSRELSKQALLAAMQKSDFLANMSHEIRTPMNAVLGMAEMALREEMSQDAREYIRQIQSSGKHLLVIINDILDFSKIDSGKMEIIETTYRPEACIEDISHLVNSRIGSKDLDFLIDMPYDMPTELIGDNIRIQQVLINLLTNAIKFTPRGKIILRFSLTFPDENNVMIRAEVEDTGNGIKKQDMDKLFESFQQVDSKRNRNIEGTGLGLAICKQLMLLMGGNISVTSEYGKGSIFSIDFPQKIFRKAPTLPMPETFPTIYIFLANTNVKQQIIKDLSKVGLHAIDLEDANLTNSGKPCFFITERCMINCSFVELAQQHTSAHFLIIDAYNGPNDLKAPNIKILRKPVTSIKLFSALGIGNFEDNEYDSGDNIFAFTAPEANVLIVDDNRVNLTVARGLLEPLHMKIDVASSAAECIEQIKQKPYDIIFMDHMMPEVDGIETTHIIRRMITGYETVPIIALTANAVGGAREMFLQEGMNDFLAKPIESNKIVAMVKKWLPEEKILPVDKTRQEENNGKNGVCSLNGQNSFYGQNCSSLQNGLNAENGQSADNGWNGSSSLSGQFANDGQNGSASLNGQLANAGQNDSASLNGQLANAGQNGSASLNGKLANAGQNGSASLDGQFANTSQNSIPIAKGQNIFKQLCENRNLLSGDAIMLNNLATIGINVSSALTLVGSEKLYLQIVKEFYFSIDKHAELIEKTFSENRIKDYVVEVHSLKSSSKQMGADSLSAYAALMEKAGNENDLSCLQYGTPALLEDLKALQNSLRPLFPELQTEEALPKADKKSILHCLTELQNALNDMDTLAIDDAIEMFRSYEYESPEDVSRLEQLTKGAEEFDIDFCLEIASDWKTKIEND